MLIREAVIWDDGYVTVIVSDGAITVSPSVVTMRGDTVTIAPGAGAGTHRIGARSRRPKPGCYADMNAARAILSRPRWECAHCGSDRGELLAFGCTACVGPDGEP